MNDASESGAYVGNKIATWEFVTLAAAVMALNALAVNIVVPGLGQMGTDLGVVNPNHRQFVITSYMVGMALALLPYGPASDRFGRRKPLLFGLGIFVLASVAVLFTRSFELLLCLRFLQGIGAAAIRVITVAMIRDKFSGRAMAETMSLVISVFMAAPVFAPLLGQAALLVGDWRTIFLIIGLGGGIVATWLALRMPETQHPADVRAFTLRSISGGLAVVIKNRVAFCYIVASALMFGSLYGYINSAQQIFVDTFGVGPLFPTLFASVAAAMAVTSFLNSYLVRRFGIRRLSHGALVTFIAVSSVWWSLTLMGPIHLCVFLSLMTLAMMASGMIFANFNALVMEPLGHVAGAGAAVQGFVQTLGGALIGTVIGQSFNGSTGPLAGGFLGFGLCSLLCVLLAEQGRLFQHSPPQGHH